MAYDERNGSTGGFSKRKPKKEATVSLQHDTNKYEEYFAMMCQLEGTIYSPCGKHEVHVSVQKSEGSLRTIMAEIGMDKQEIPLAAT